MSPNEKFAEEYGTIDDHESVVSASPFLFVTAATALELRAYEYHMPVQHNLKEYPYLQDSLLTEDGHECARK